MNKKLFLKLGLGLGVVATISSAALISYEQKNNSTKEIEASKSDTDSLDSNNQELVAEDRGSVSSSTNLKDSKFERTQENTQEKTQQNVQQNTQQNVQENTQQNAQQEELEKEYYTLIKEAWQRQKDYVDSIEDPWIKQSVQTPYSAAFAESTRLLLEYPENREIIDISLKKFIDEKVV